MFYPETQCRGPREMSEIEQDAWHEELERQNPSITETDMSKQKTYYTLDELQPTGQACGDEAEMDIRWAESLEQAIRKIMAHHASTLAQNLEDDEVTALRLSITTVSWGDCWHITSNAKEADELRNHGECGVGVYVQDPGSHPGGNQFWVTPDQDVHGLCIEEERQE